MPRIHKMRTGYEQETKMGNPAETFRDVQIDAKGNSVSTSIYYLLEGASGPSTWHRVLDSAEVWHFYDGSPMRLRLSRDDGVTPLRELTLGKDIFAVGEEQQQRPQIVVERGEWQHAESLGDWTLVGCTVAPAFRFERFEMAEKGWEPRIVEGKV